MKKATTPEIVLLMPWEFMYSQLDEDTIVNNLPVLRQRCQKIVLMELDNTNKRVLITLGLQVQSVQFRKQFTP
jgi:hypothetical protein